MGDMADMAMEGIFCSGCGDFLGGDGDGIPRLCAWCDGTAVMPPVPPPPVSRYVIVSGGATFQGEVHGNGGVLWGPRGAKLLRKASRGEPVGILDPENPSTDDGLRVIEYIALYPRGLDAVDDHPRISVPIRGATVELLDV